MKEDAPGNEPEEFIPESIRITQEMMKDRFDIDIEDETVESSIDEPVAPTVELDSVEVRTKLLEDNREEMSLSMIYHLLYLDIPKSIVV